MDFLLPALALFTLGAGMALAYWSQKRAERAMRSPDHQKSSLSTDGPGPSPFRPAGTTAKYSDQG